MTVATDPRKTGITAAATLLAASAVAVSHTGDTNETVLATVQIPGGSIGPNGGLLIYASWSMTNSANVKTPRIRFGGIGGTIYSGLNLTTSLSWSDIRRIRNRNSASSQIASCSASTSTPVGSSGVALTTSTLDTSVAQDLVFTGALALGSETITLENYEVWLIP